MERFEIRARVASRACPVVAGRGALDRLPGLLEELGPFDGVELLHDPVLEGAARALAGRIPGLGRIPVAAGEAAKSWSRVEALAAELLERGVGRSSVLLVLGGGTLTDLGAFLAAVYMRGIACVLLPSTLLGMADAAIGGKSGVHLGAFKNVLGAIVQPRAVVADTALLATLPAAEVKEGAVEIVKTAMMLDAGAFAWLEGALDALLALDREAVDAAVPRTMRLKAAVVEGDERDHGRRRLLNFGHTVGHAIETVTGFATRHGEAVALGMPIEIRMTGGSGEERLRRLLARMELRDRLPSGVDAASLWSAMGRDKKRERRQVLVAAPAAIGEGRVVPVTKEDLERAL